MPPPDRLDTSDILISPVTFLQVYQSSGELISALLEHDIAFQRWLGASAAWRQVARLTLVPTYYHWITSGYVATVANEMAGWMYVRGRGQILTIDTLVTHRAWRRRGVGRALLRFAESLARELNRNWLGLAVTLANTSAVQLYEREGYRPGHSRVMVSQKPGNLPVSSTSINLRPVLGIAAEQAYRHFAGVDVSAGEIWDRECALQMIEHDPYHQWGQDWVIEVGRKPVGFLNKHSVRNQTRMYLACEPDWWASAEVASAVLSYATPANRAASIQARLGSSEHHNAVRDVFHLLGFEEQPAERVWMFKQLNHAPSNSGAAPGR